MKTTTNQANFTKSKSSAIAALSVALLGFAATEASALLSYDLRASAVTGSVVLNGPKSFGSVSAGDSVTFDIYAIVTGGDTILNNDGYQFSFFNIVTDATAGVTGVLTGLDGTALAPTGMTLNPLFNVGAVARGTPSLTVSGSVADGIGDIGGSATNSAGGWIKPRTTALDTAAGTPITDPAITGGNYPASGGLEYFMGQVKLLITGAVPNNRVGVKFVLPAAPLGISAIGSWREDTVVRSTAAFQNSSPAAINPVPEPSAFGMVILGAMGICGMRRIGVRRSS